MRSRSLRPSRLFGILALILLTQNLFAQTTGPQVAAAAAAMAEGSFVQVLQNATVQDALAPVGACAGGIGNNLGDSSALAYDDVRQVLHGTGACHDSTPFYFYMDLATNNWTNTCPISGTGVGCTLDAQPQRALSNVLVLLTSDFGQAGLTQPSTGANHTFTNVPFDSSTISTGLAATFDVTVVNATHTYTVAINNHGYGWNDKELWVAVPWSALKVRPVGYQIIDSNTHIQQVSTAGTTGATVPTWNTVGGTTTDGSVTWTDHGVDPSSLGGTITIKGGRLGGVDGTNDLVIGPTDVSSLLQFVTQISSNPAIGADRTITNVGFDSTTSPYGTGATFNVRIVSNTYYSVFVDNISAPGSGQYWGNQNYYDPTYNIYGDQITIKGGRLGGVDGVNDIVLGVTGASMNLLFSHGYNFTAVDPVTGTVYYHLYGSNGNIVIYQHPVGASVWTMIYNGPEAASSIDGMAWWSRVKLTNLTNPAAYAVPHGGANAINRGAPNGILSLFQPDLPNSINFTNVAYTGTNPAGAYPTVSVYDEKLNASFFGGGSGTTNVVWRMDFDQTVTRLCDAPAPIAYSSQGQGEGWRLVDEPGVGRLLFIGNSTPSQSGHNSMYELDPDAPGSGCMGTYTLTATQPPISIPNGFGAGATDALVTAPLKDLGVVALVGCVGSSCDNFWLYKPIGDLETYSQRCAHSEVVICKKLGDVGEFVPYFSGSGASAPLQPSGEYPINGCAPVCYYGNTNRDTGVTVSGDATLKMTVPGTNSAPAPITSFHWTGTPPSLTWTNLTISSSTPTELTDASATGRFASGMVGSSVDITNGTNVTFGGYVIATFIDSNHVTVTSTPLTNVLSNGTVTSSALHQTITGSPDSAGCGGTGATFLIESNPTYPSLYFPSLTGAGSGYTIPCAITYLGTRFYGGATPANDFVATVGTGPDTGGYIINFSDTLDKSFGTGEEFYVQWQQYFSPTFISNSKTPNDWGGGEGFKQDSVSLGDPDNMTVAGSCQPIDLPVQNVFNLNIPLAYQSCTGSSSHDRYTPFQENFPYNCSITGVTCTDTSYQDAVPDPYCLYSQVPSVYGGCFQYTDSEVLTFQEHLIIGPIGAGGLLNTFTWSGNAPAGSGSVSNIPQTSSNGRGSHAGFDVSWAAGVFTVSIHDLDPVTGTRGYGYDTNGADTLTILGHNFTGGVDGTNNLTISTTGALFNVVGAQPLDEYVNSYFEEWVAHDGQHSQPIYAYGPFSISAVNPGFLDYQKFGKLWLLPYDTDRFNTTYPEASTNYSHVVISTARIADPVSSGFNPPATALPSRIRLRP